MPARGSAKLIRERPLPKSEFDRFVKLLDDHESVELLNVWVKGQPKPDFISGTVNVKIGDVGAVIERMLEHDKLRLHLKAFPIGLPDPEAVLIDFQQGTLRT